MFMGCMFYIHVWQCLQSPIWASVTKTGVISLACLAQSEERLRVGNG